MRSLGGGGQAQDICKTLSSSWPKASRERERERERAHTAREEKANRPGGINKQMRLASSSLSEKSGLALCLPYIKGHTHTQTPLLGEVLYPCFILFCLSQLIKHHSVQGGAYIKNPSHCMKSNKETNAKSTQQQARDAMICPNDIYMYYIFSMQFRQGNNQGPWHDLRALGE